MSAKKLGSRINRENIASFVTELANRERDRKFTDPISAMKKFSEHAKCKLSLLEAKVVAAKSVISKSTERMAAGELDDATYYAETVSARLLVSMFDSLQALYAQAVNASDIFAVRRVGVVADKLAAVSDGLLMETRYPQDASLRKSLADQSVAMARGAYEDVMQSLRGVHMPLGVQVAEFPAKPDS